MTALQYRLATREDDQPFSVAFSPCTRPVGTLADEVDAAARDIASEASRLNKPIWVCSSGGIDSEVICDSLHRQGIHFRVLTLEFSGAANAHDIFFAPTWCKAHGVEQKIVSLDMQHFFAHEVAAYADAGYISGHPFRYIHLRLLEIVEQLGGYAVLGGGEQTYFTRTVNGVSTITMQFDLGYAAPLRWCESYKATHEPHFFFRTPELVYAYALHPLVACALEHPEIFVNRDNSFVFKRVVYSSIWPTMRSRHKYNGFEKLRVATEECARALRTRFKGELTPHIMAIAEMRAQLAMTIDH